MRARAQGDTGVIAGGALLTGATYPIVPNAWHGFVGSLASNAEFDNFDWWKMHNARAFWRLLLPEPVTLAEVTLPTSPPKPLAVLPDRQQSLELEEPPQVQPQVPGHAQVAEVHRQRQPAQPAGRP